MECTESDQKYIVGSFRRLMARYSLEYRMCFVLYHYIWRSI